MLKPVRLAHNITTQILEGTRSAVIDLNHTFREGDTFQISNHTYLIIKIQHLSLRDIIKDHYSQLAFTSPSKCQHNLETLPQWNNHECNPLVRLVHFGETAVLSQLNIDHRSAVHS